MRTFVALIKKELTEQARTGKLLILGMIFVLFGIMNPTIAKLTPLLIEAMADSLAQSGMTVTAVTVTAMDSWVQFFKNIPMALIIFVLLESGIFTKEYSSGTLILSLTKGLKRYKTVTSKSAVLVILWTVSYWVYFALTYCISEVLWDNSVAQNLAFSVVCWWLFGIFIIGLIILFSTLSRSGAGVLLGTGGIVLVMSLIGVIPKVNEYLPMILTDGNSLIYGAAEPKTYMAAVIITAILSIVFLALSIPVFNKKQL